MTGWIVGSSFVGLSTVKDRSRVPLHPSRQPPQIFTPPQLTVTSFARKAATCPKKHSLMNNPQVHHPSLNYGSISEQDEVQDSIWDEPDVPMEKTITSPKATRRYCLVGILIILGCLLVATLVGKVESRNQRVGWTKQEQSDTTTITTTTPPFQLCHLSGQKLNHFDQTCNITWTQPYFVSDQYFGGPGSPILVILGGEDPVNNILYPFVSERLAQEFQAYVIQTEHRFYGNSQPTRYMSTTNTTTSLNADEQVSNQDLNLYLSPEQAILDWIAIIRHVQLQLKCSLHNKTSPNYCPVITIGGSYPGFLSAMMRLNYPTVVDIAYASSAPLKLYEHAPDFDTNGYYKYVTKVRFYQTLSAHLLVTTNKVLFLGVSKSIGVFPFLA